MTTQLSIFIDGDTEVTAARTGTGTVYLDLDKSGPGLLTVFLGNNGKTKLAALEVLAHLTAAVESLPDDPEPLPLDVPEHVHDLLGALDRSIRQARADRRDPLPAPSEIVTAP
jgi:hypothetical protein